MLVACTPFIAVYKKIPESILISSLVFIILDYPIPEAAWFDASMNAETNYSNRKGHGGVGMGGIMGS